MSLPMPPFARSLHAETTYVLYATDHHIHTAFYAPILISISIPPALTTSISLRSWYPLVIVDV
ncbi:hypothetical protein PISMIDRAFT_611178 [Pisolithus microcarpus 441]|uniref:Uncharacterized protein n=1 Tax=Pisolithus microcarpus 441 TaxID=765257 RepID=A0A0C9ZG49_9AGAM|nr:hypothetical protein PISMIDRAFT_611178 [Pisolithus microcarpus 441]